jgi:glycosyltransferase involved in cell wall biosynthesis
MPYPDPKLPFVSVIIPVFNDQGGIDSCISALERQRYPADLLEVIVVDNASDVPVRIDAEPAFQARVIRCESPGSYAARNAGLQVAAGAVLAFTDADCVPDPGWVSNGVAALGVDLSRIVGGDVRLRLSSRPTAVELYQGITGFAQRDNIATRGFTVTANLFAPREAFAKVGLFDTNLLSGGDLEWSRRATANGYALAFAEDAVVETLPRKSLRAAARQVRRVTGGRKALRSDEGGSTLEHIGPRRGALSSLRWILGYSGLGWWDRLRVLTVATLLYGVRVAERVMLALGRHPERR